MTAPTSSPSPDLDRVLNDLEAALAALGSATRSRDADGIEHQARHLQDLLGRMARAVDPTRRTVLPHPLPPYLRTRLMAAGRLIALQRSALARAAQPVDQAVALLTAPDPTLVYVEGGLPTLSGYPAPASQRR
jgi:hypothetical protein